MEISILYKIYIMDLCYLLVMMQAQQQQFGEEDYYFKSKTKKIQYQFIYRKSIQKNNVIKDTSDK